MATSFFRDPPMVPSRSERVHYEYERHLLDTYAERRAPEQPRARVSLASRMAVLIGLRAAKNE